MSNLKGNNKINYSNKMDISHEMYFLIEKGSGFGDITIANYVGLIDNLYERLNSE